MTLLKRDYRFGDSINGMDRFFDRSFWDSDFWPGLASGFPTGSFGERFPVDIYGDGESYFLVAELPGVQKEDVDLKLENAVLTINAKRKRGEGENATEHSMTRSITVGDDINPDEVMAKLENGVLTVTLPKVEERKPKSIAIS